MANVGIPVSADFTASGAFNVEALPQESFTWLGAHYTVDNAEMDASVFNAAFDLSENEVDAIATLNVAMTAGGQNDFRLALRNALLNGDGADASDNKMTLKLFLEGYAKAELDTHLATNGIPDAIEAEEVTAITLNDMEEDCSQGALNMWTNMNAVNNSASLNIIARQFPRERFQAAGESSLAMPGQAGDKITFRFGISQSYDALNITQGAATGVQTTSVTSADYPASQTGKSYGISARSIDVVVTLK